jgi:hypothetical protein
MRNIAVVRVLAGGCYLHRAAMNVLRCVEHSSLCFHLRRFPVLLNGVKLCIISWKTVKRVVVSKLHQLFPLSLYVHWGIKYKDRVEVFKRDKKNFSICRVS